MTPQIRATKAKEFVHKLGLDWEEVADEAKGRAKRLMTRDFTWSPNKDGSIERFTTTFRKAFTAVCESPGMIDQNWPNHVFFKADDMDRFLVIRWQRAGICCLHACVVLQHYLQCLRCGNHNHAMLDISEFLRERLSRDLQKKFIVDGNTGFGSVEFFKLITGVKDNKLMSINIPMKSVFEEDFHTEVDRVLQRFQKVKEPALVSCFPVELAFSSPDILVHDGEIDIQNFYDFATSRGKKPNTRILHSMLLIGARKDESTGKVWFLLQNWWKEKLFCAISAEYFASCTGATISFVGKTDVFLQPGYHVVDAEYAETSIEIEECKFHPVEG